jgi:putative ATP-dependent endonuclease of the OLD family
VKIESVSIKNLRCIREVDVTLDDYTCLVGPNGAGKSTLLCALNIFFRNIQGSTTDLMKLIAEDFHHQDTKEEIEITVTFVDLSDEAKEDFKGYVRQNKLIISAVAKYDGSTQLAEVLQFGRRLGMAVFAPFFKQKDDGAKAPEPRKIYEEFRTNHTALPAWKSIDASAQALKDYEAENPEKCVPLLSQDQFYGATKGSNRLEKHLQWVYIPAVKDASSEDIEGRNTALGKLLARTVRSKVDFNLTVENLLQTARQSYEKMLQENQTLLSELSTSLQARLREWAHPDATLRLEWQQDPEKAVRADLPLAAVVAGESDFEGKLTRFGHGFQRSFLLAVLHELAVNDGDQGPRLILGCEEPELYQHPPQARHLASVFENLAGNNSQVILTTHSPYFVSGRNFESIRMVRRDELRGCSSIQSFDYKRLAARYSAVCGDAMIGASAALLKVHQLLQPALNEMFFTQRLVLVEGLEDIAYIHSWMLLTGRWERFRSRGCHLVNADGKSEIIRPLIIAQGLNIPVIAVFDADGDEAEGKFKKEHIRDNIALLSLLGGNPKTPFPDDTVWGAQYVQWAKDIGTVVCEELRSSMVDAEFQTALEEVRKSYDFSKKPNKATLFIGSLLAICHSKGAQSQSLDRLCDWIVT